MTEYMQVRVRMLLTMVGAWLSGSASAICFYLVWCGCFEHWGFAAASLLAVATVVQLGFCRRLWKRLKALPPDEVADESLKLQRETKARLVLAGCFTVSAGAFGWLYTRRHDSMNLAIACMYTAVAMLGFVFYFRNRRMLKNLSAS